MTVDCKQKEFLDYHAWSADAQAQVEAGVHISDDEFDRLRDHNEAVRRAERAEQVRA